MGMTNKTIDEFITFFINFPSFSFLLAEKPHKIVNFPQYPHDKPSIAYSFPTLRLLK